MSKHYLRLVRNALRSLRHPRLIRWAWWRVATQPVTQRDLWIPCRDTAANGVTIGVFFAMLIPLPFQMLAAALVAMRARANIPLAMAFCWISNPLSTGPLIWAQCKTGDWMREDLGVQMPRFLTRDLITINDIGTVNSASFLLGMISFAVIGAIIAYPLVYMLSMVLPRHLPVRRRRGANQKPATKPTEGPKEDAR
ncbi:MAG: DUF2062 domain-containing protein [Luteolibacter sp.]